MGVATVAEFQLCVSNTEKRYPIIYSLITIRTERVLQLLSATVTEGTEGCVTIDTNCFCLVSRRLQCSLAIEADKMFLRFKMNPQYPLDGNTFP